MEDALENADNPDLKAVRLMDGLEGFLQEEEYVEGMAGTGEDEHAHDHDHGEDETAYDEHIWLSLRNARQSCQVIAGQLAAMDEAHAEEYLEHAVQYGALLDNLDQEYKYAVAGAPYHTLVFGDRFPFRYLTEDYGLEYYAAFPDVPRRQKQAFIRSRSSRRRYRSWSFRRCLPSMVLTGRSRVLLPTTRRRGTRKC